MGWAIAGRQVRRLERIQAKRAIGTSQDGYAFSLHPTCPPSTSLNIRGGYAWQVVGYLIQYGWYFPTYTVDLTDVDKVSVRGGVAGYSYTFTNPYWYVPCAVVYSQEMYPPQPPDTWPDDIEDDSIYLYGVFIGMPTPPPYLYEVETAAEAEEIARRIQGDLAGGDGTVCGYVILKNNGNTDGPNQYEPIDMVNRGRSYLFGAKRYGWGMG